MSEKNSKSDWGNCAVWPCGLIYFINWDSWCSNLDLVQIKLAKLILKQWINQQQVQNRAEPADNEDCYKSAGELWRSCRAAVRVLIARTCSFTPVTPPGPTCDSNSAIFAGRADTEDVCLGCQWDWVSQLVGESLCLWWSGGLDRDLQVGHFSSCYAKLASLACNQYYIWFPLFIYYSSIHLS